MKKVLLLLVLFLFPSLVYADSININCNKTEVTPGEIISCNITGSTTTEVNGVEAKLSLTNLSLESISTSSGWFGDGNDGKFDLYSDPKTGSFAIGQITVKASDTNGKITFSNPEFTNKNFENVGVTVNVVNITVSNVSQNETPGNTTPSTTTTQKNNQSPTSEKTKSNNAYLSSLTIEGKDIDFNKDTLEYKIEIDDLTKSIIINAKPEDTKASVKIEGNENLKNNSKIKIVVTAENGETKDYILLIVIPDSNQELSDNNNLSKLEIEGYKIEFNKNKTNYLVKIRDEDKLQINYEVEDENSVVKIEGNEDLKNNSKIKVIVTAENGNTKVYEITINKSNNALHDILLIGGGIVIGFCGTILIRKVVTMCKNKKRTKEVSI